MPVSLNDLREAFEFVCAGGEGEHQAFLCKQSGKLYCHSELCDDLDILPDDIDDTEKFLQIPDKKELDLGKPLALEFTTNSCLTTTPMFGSFSADEEPTPDSRSCWINGARSPNGMLSRRKPRKEP